MVSEGLLFPTALQAARLGSLSMRTVRSTAWHQEDSWREGVQPP